MRLCFFDDAELPLTNLIVEQTPSGTALTRDNARFAALGCDFLVTKAEAEIVVEVQSDASFKPHFETRIVEGLQFILARSLSPRVLVRSDEGRQSLELSSAVPRSVRTKLDPPLAGGYEGYLEHSWQLFSLYMEYIVRTNEARHWHTCSSHLHNACEASANSLDAWAIGVCLAVEGISSLVDVKQTDAEKKAKKNVSKALTKFIDSQGWDEILTNRAKGLVGQLQTLRVIDRLRNLSAIGHVQFGTYRGLVQASKQAGTPGGCRYAKLQKARTSNYARFGLENHGPDVPHRLSPYWLYGKVSRLRNLSIPGEGLSARCATSS